MVKVYYTFFDRQLPTILFEKYMSMIPSEMRSQNRRFRKWEDRTANILGKILLGKGLEEFGYNFSSLDQIIYDCNNRPGLKGGVDFNISHSGKYVVCILGEGVRLGVDIEEIKSIDFADYRDVMSDKQWEKIVNSIDPLKKFYEFWVIKESIVKADGRGLSVPLKNISIHHHLAECENKAYQYSEIFIDSGYCAAFATANRFDDDAVDYEFLDICR